MFRAHYATSVPNMKTTSIFFLEVDDGDSGRLHAIQCNSMFGIDARDNVMKFINNKDQQLTSFNFYFV